MTDERGRRRFHGAFTGGYSAGYFNTVGSKEGWAPSTFKSSRSGRDGSGGGGGGGGASGGGGGAQKRRVQTVEDFMDEEDRSDIGFAPKHVTTTNEYAVAEKRPANLAPDGFLEGANLSELVLSNENSVGKKLLQQMGWREGQGIGPRVASRPRNKAEKQSRWGDEHAAGKTFAPVEVELSMDSYPAKDNLHGVGYRPMSNADFNLDAGQKKRYGAGFGVGAMEMDDEDVYDEASGDKSEYDRFAGGPAGDDAAAPNAPGRHLFRPKSSSGGRAGIGRSGGGGGSRGGTFAASSSSSASRAAAAAAEKRHQQSVIDTLFGSNEPPLRGFRAASVRLDHKKKYPPEPVPPGFNPFHVFAEPGPAFSQHASTVNRSETGGVGGTHRQLSAKDRMTILGEQPIPTRTITLEPPRQQQQTSEDPALPARPPPPKSTLTSKDAMKPGVFRPFRKEPEKEARYMAYLDNVPFDNAHLPPHDRQREVEQFVQAAKMYRPAVGAMASRFAPAADDNANDGSKDGGAASRKAGAGERLHQPAGDLKEKAIDARSNAVDLNMFGRMTRESHEWHPASLLCKRFDLRDPYPKSALVGCAAGTKKSALNGFNTMEGAPEAVKQFNVAYASGGKGAAAAAAAALPTGFQAPPNRPPPGDPRLLEPVPDVKVDKMPPRPAMDIFKAIFSDSSSSSEDEDESGGGAAAAGGGGGRSGAAAPPMSASASASASASTPAATSTLRTPQSALTIAAAVAAARKASLPSSFPSTSTAHNHGGARPFLQAPPGGSHTLQQRQQQQQSPPPRHVFHARAGKTTTVAEATAAAASLAAAMSGAAGAGEDPKPLPRGLAAPSQQHHAAPKLTLVHTYSDLTESRQQEVTDQAKAYAAAPAWSTALPTTDKVWAEKPTAGVGSGSRADSDSSSSKHKKKSSKSSKEKKHRHKSKSKKGKDRKKGKSKSSKLSFDASDEDSNSDSDGGGKRSAHGAGGGGGGGVTAKASDATLLQTMRAVGVSLQDMHALKYGGGGGGGGKRLPPREGQDASKHSSRRNRPTASDFF